MSPVVDALSALLRDARRVTVSPDAEVSTTTRAGVISVRVTDGGVQLLSATLDTRPRVAEVRGEQLPLPGLTGQREATLAPERPALDDAPVGDEGPAPINGVRVGDRLTLDDEPIEVLGVDDEGFVWRTVATDAKGRPDDEGEVYWHEVEDLGLGRWRVTGVDTETPYAKTKRERSTKPKRTTKAKAARSGPVLDDETAILWTSTDTFVSDGTWATITAAGREAVRS